MAPPSNRTSRSTRRRPASLVAAMTALAVAGAPTAALASGPDAPVVDHAPDSSVLAEALSAVTDASPVSEPGITEGAALEPETVPAPVQSEPKPLPATPPAEPAAALSTPDPAPLEASDAMPAPTAAEEAPVDVVDPAPEAPADAPPADPPADTPAVETPPADAAEAPPAEGAAAPSSEPKDDKEPPPPASPQTGEGTPGGDPPPPPVAAEAPAAPPEIVVTPVRLILRGVDGSTVEVPFSALPAPVTTTPASTVIVPLPLPADPSGAEGAEGVDPSELYGPAFPPGFWDDYDGSRLTWMPGTGAVPGVAAPADPTAGAADPAVVVAVTSGLDVAAAPTTLTGSAALAPILPIDSQPPGNGRADRLPSEVPLAQPVPAPPVRAIPVASTARFTAEVIAAAARTRDDRPGRAGAVAGAVTGTAKAAASAASLTVKLGPRAVVKASTSPWLPFGLLALALLYLLGQRAMDRGSKLSYAGRAGEPDDELIEL